MPPRTVNEILLDREIKHAVYLIRLAGGEAKWIQSQIPALRKRILQVIAPILSEIDTSGTLTIEQQLLIDQASTQAAEVSREFFRELQESASERLIVIAELEMDFERLLLEKSIPIDLNFKVPSDIFLRANISSNPISGKSLGKWFSEIPADIGAAVNEQIREGVLAGESNNDIMRRIRGTREAGFKDGIIGRKGRDAENLMRTGVMGASNRSRQMFLEENIDVIKGYDWVLTLDSRTCSVCVAGEAENPYDINNPPELPAHVLCRCIKVAVVKSWEELGIDLEEMTPGERATMDGQRAESLTYDKWFKQQSAKDQLDILGPSRYKAYKKGYDVTDFADRGEVLTLEELRQLEPDLFNFNQN